MSILNKTMRPARRFPSSLLGVMLGVLISAQPWTAHAGVLETDDSDAKSGLLDKRDDVKTKARSKPGTPGHGYQLRCWQYGRLIIEEDNLSPPPDTQIAYKLSLREREAKRAPVHLVETLNATCLIQPSRVAKQESRP